jgi:hypothetical protein
VGGRRARVAGRRGDLGHPGAACGGCRLRKSRVGVCCGADQWQARVWGKSVSCGMLWGVARSGVGAAVARRQYLSGACLSAPAIGQASAKPSRGVPKASREPQGTVEVCRAALRSAAAPRQAHPRRSLEGDRVTTAAHKASYRAISRLKNAPVTDSGRH